MAPDAHPALTTPNKIGAADFAGWVQERGLYFAEKWDGHYQTPLAMNDPGEKPLAGSLLWARYGKGTFVYTGLAFFRQLPGRRARRVPAVRESDGARQGSACALSAATAPRGDAGVGRAARRDAGGAAVPDLGRDLRDRHRRARVEVAICAALTR